ncbi:MAG: hypothetical protein VX492_04065 [Candidatus Thermoplasmatota archaeon]|nr:hypothetical protein [Candidatus Thermoplasmatota archaeon]
MSYLSEPDFLFSLTISALGISLMSWWLFNRISLKLREVEERSNWGINSSSGENE